MSALTPLPVVAYKPVKAADWDDDRHDGPGREPLNPRHAELVARTQLPEYDPWRIRLRKGRFYGWHPALTLRRVNGQWTEELTHLPEFRGHKGTVGGFYVTMYAYTNGEHRIVVGGGDDTSLERCNMTKEVALRVFNAIRDHVSIDTLRNVHGFKYT